MRIALFIAAFTAFLLGLEFDAAAQYNTAYDLMVECKGGNKADDLAQDFAKFSCAMYIAGMIDGLRVAGAYFKLPLPMCMPNEAFLMDQERLIYLKWATANPEHLNATGRIGVLMAFTAAYPCKGPSKAK